MSDPVAVRLSNALRDIALVKFTRRFEAGSWIGYVLDLGPRWFLLAEVDGRIWFDGFSCLRVSDVRALDVPHRHAAFVESALRERAERIPDKPRIELRDLARLLLAASRQFPLVTIHREEIDPDACDIGRVEWVRGDRLSLLRIDPDANWETEPVECDLRDITRVDFGGSYEEALQIVGGRPAAG